MQKGPAARRAFCASGGLSSAGIRIRGGMRKVLSGKPFAFLVIFREIDALDLKDHRTGPVIAAGDHHAVIVCPAMHDGAALKRGIDIAADGIPCLAAEIPVHEMIKVVLLGRAPQDKGVARLEERSGTGHRIGQVLLLKIRKTFGFKDCDPPVRSVFSERAFLLFGILFFAPQGNPCDQIGRQCLFVREANGSLAHIKVFQFIGKRCHGLIPGVQADMLFGCGKMDQVSALPIGRHRPGDAFLRTGQRRGEDRADLTQLWLDALILKGNVLKAMYSSTVFGFSQ